MPKSRAMQSMPEDYVCHLCGKAFENNSQFRWTKDEEGHSVVVCKWGCNAKHRSKPPKKSRIA